jgi:pentatricopeptide repeat protein
MDIRLKWSSACRIDFLLFTFFKYSAVFFILVMMQKTIAWRQMFQTVHAVSPACFKHYAARKFGASSWMHKGELCSSLIFHRNHILRRDLTNVPQPFEMSLSNPMLSVIESNEEVKWRRFSQIKREMANCIELHDFDKAQTLYEEIKDKVNLHGNIDTVLMFLSICQHASQIGIVEDVIINLKEQHIGIHEQVYFSLIRCYCDGNMIDKAWEIVKSMEGLGVEPRLRTFQPVLEACERVGDIGETLKVFEYLMNVRLQPRSEQLTALLRTYTQYRELEGDKMDNHHTIKERVDDILKQASTHMIGFPTEDLERIAAGAAGATVEGVRDFGVLVENLEDIDGPVICDEHLHIDSSVIALNATYNSTGRLLDQYSPTPNNPHLPIGLKVEGIHFIPQKFVVWSEKSSKFLQPDNMKFGENDGTSDGGNSNKNHPFCAPTSSSLIMLKNKNPDVEQQLSARLVHIADKNCHCPHCFGKILKIPMSNEEKKEVREALIRTAADQSLTHITHLEVAQT